MNNREKPRCSRNVSTTFPSTLGLRLEVLQLEPLIGQLYEDFRPAGSCFIRHITSAMNEIRDFVQSIQEHVRQYRMPHSRSIHAANGRLDAGANVSRSR